MRSPINNKYNANSAFKISRSPDRGIALLGSMWTKAAIVSDRDLHRKKVWAGLAARGWSAYDLGGRGEGDLAWHGLVCIPLRVRKHVATVHRLGGRLITALGVYVYVNTTRTGSDRKFEAMWHAF